MKLLAIQSLLRLVASVALSQYGFIKMILKDCNEVWVQSLGDLFNLRVCLSVTVT